MRTALVTGSAGFIGRHMAAALEAAGYDVTHCDPKHVWPRAEWDCRSTFQTVCSAGPDKGKPLSWDLVVHCAAKVDGREAIDGKPALIGAINLQLDAALWEWALRARPGRIVYLSSSAAYPVHYQCGAYAGHRLQERDLGAGDPDQTYGWVKLTGERIATEVRAAGIPVTIVRPFSGYGADQDLAYPFPAMIKRALDRESPFRVWGDGEQVRDFIHVNDIVAAVLKLVDQEVDGPVNLGTGRGVSMNQLARMIMRAAGQEAPIINLTDKPVGVQYRVASPALMRTYYWPTISLEAGIEGALCDAYEQRRAAA